MKIFTKLHINLGNGSEGLDLCKQSVTQFFAAANTSPPETLSISAQQPQLAFDQNTNEPYPGYIMDWPSQAAEDASATSAEGQSGELSAAIAASVAAAAGPNGTYTHYHQDWP